MYRQSEQLGMGTDSNQIDYIAINPNQKKIIFNMTFHTSLILSFQRMGFVCFRNGQILDKQADNVFKCSDFLGI